MSEPRSHPPSSIEQGGCAGPASARLPQRLRGAAHWALLIALLIGQYLLFYRHVTREIAWAYPKNFDQAAYLYRAYETFDRWARLGAWEGIAYGAGFRGNAPLANGALIHLEAAGLFRLLGPSRITALGLNFLHWAILQIALLYTVRWMSGRWQVAWAGLGLLLAARTGFQSTGGIADFRMDLIVFTSFAIFMCLVIRSELFGSLGWSAAAAVAVAYTIVFRFLTLAYFLPIFAILLAFIPLAARWAEGDVAQRRRWALRRWRNLWLSAALVALLTAPVLLHHWTGISNYYLRLHASGPQRYIRAAMFKNTSWRAAIAYYPRSLALHHAGLGFAAVAAMLLLAWMARPADERSDCPARFGDARPLLLFAVICFLVPLTALTLDVDKNAAVGDVLVGPLLWIVMLLMACPLRRIRGIPAASGGQWRAMMRFVGLVALAAGLGTQVYSYTRHSEFGARRAEVMRVLGMYDRIWAISGKRGAEQPAIANDSFADFLFPDAINVMVYERHGQLLGAHEILATDYTALTDRQILAGLAACDFAIFSNRVPPRVGGSPFDQSIHRARAAMVDAANHNMTVVEQYEAMDRQVVLFSRRAR